MAASVTSRREWIGDVCGDSRDPPTRATCRRALTALSTPRASRVEIRRVRRDTSFEPSPYELVTLRAIVIFVATGLRLRLVFMPLLLLLVLLNIGYSSVPFPFFGQT